MILFNCLSKILFLRKIIKNRLIESIALLKAWKKFFIFVISIAHILFFISYTILLKYLKI